MRVAFLSPHAQALNAIGNQLCEKLGYFLSQGAEVRLFVKSAERLHPDLKPHCQVVDRAEAAGPVWDYLISADLVIVEYPHYFELLQYLPLLVGNKPRVLVDYHGVTPPVLWQGPNRELLEAGLSQRGLVWCADAAVTHSRFTRTELLEATQFPAERVEILECALPGKTEATNGEKQSLASLHSSHSQTLPLPNLKEKLGLREEFLLLYVGRLAANKRVPVLVEALALVLARGLEAHLALIGDVDDLYAAQAEQCLELADKRGVRSRVHVLGQVGDRELAGAYRSADVLVIPSIHEGFCVPVAEAMAAGLPVIAARAGALPESVGPAGLTFKPDDAEDLTRQILRVAKIDFQPAAKTLPEKSGPRRVAVVGFRFGEEIVGGAERSLRTIARALVQAGDAVEVFTTCASGESDWRNDLPAGTFHQDELVLHRFPIDDHDRPRHLESVRAVLDGFERSAEVEQNYLRHSIHSTALIEALRQKIAGFDAVIVGPYLFGLTCDVARAFPEKTLLMPCFHDEPLARLETWLHVYGQVGGILYHSPEEQDFAQVQLGLNHPHALQIGTFLGSTECRFHPNYQTVLEDSVEKRNGPGPRTLVYCGRYSKQKNVPLLLEWLKKYQEEKPGRFGCVFVGEGEVALPRVKWLTDLGRVSEQRKREVLAGAVALVQPSVNESLSLVALEAWAEGTPVLVHEDCTVLTGQLARSQGGRASGTYEGFAGVLDDLWENPLDWRKLGQKGQAFVEKEYSSLENFQARLGQAIAGLGLPLRQHMRARGLDWSARCRREVWRERFGRFVKKVMESERRPHQEGFEIHLHRPRHVTFAGTRSLLLAVRMVNRGSHPLASSGPAGVVICWQVIDKDSGQVVSARQETALPSLLLPGHSQPAAVPVTMSGAAGHFEIRLWAERGPQRRDLPGSRATMELVLKSSDRSEPPSRSPFLEVVDKVLAEVHRWRRLPDTYLDVTNGRFASIKYWIKSKILGNFKQGYVDVISRQQSRVNEHLLTTLQNLAECCATLDHAVRGLQEKVERLEGKK